MNAGLHYTRGDGYYEEYKRNSSSSIVNLIEYSLTPFALDGKTVYQTDLVRQKKMGNNFGGGVFSINYQKNNVKQFISGILKN